MEAPGAIDEHADYASYLVVSHWQNEVRLFVILVQQSCGKMDNDARTSGNLFGRPIYLRALKNRQ